jgi:hypothetical protein
VPIITPIAALVIAIIAADIATIVALARAPREGAATAVREVASRWFD